MAAKATQKPLAKRQLSGPKRRIGVSVPGGAFGAIPLTRGIIDYASHQETWDLQWFDAEACSVEAIAKLRLDGVLAHFENETRAANLLKLGVPIVAVNHVANHAEIAGVGLDDYAIGRMAADHLARRGAQSLACLALKRGPRNHRRRDGFVKFAQLRKDRQAVICQLENRLAEDLQRGQSDGKLRDWLNALPKPVGLFAVNDDLALLACQICRQIGLRVPVDVAILGADNNESVCHQADPILSSVCSPFSEVGFEAAQRLTEHLVSRKTPIRHKLLPPFGVHARQSCDVCATGDVEIGHVVRVIHEGSGNTFRIADILKQVPMSRRSLELRFRATTGRSLMAEVRRLRLDQAARLLASTNYSLDRIARETGFRRGTYLNVAFLRQYGISPGRYRNALIGDAGHSDRPTVSLA